MKNMRCPKCDKSNAIEIKMTMRSDNNGFDMYVSKCKYCDILLDWESYNKLIKENYGTK